MRLDPMTDAAMGELLDGMIPGLSDAVWSSIVERADGLPLYAVETIRMLIAGGRLVQEDGEAASSRESHSVPPTSVRSRCRRRSTPSSPLGSTGSRLRIGRSSRTPRSSARRSASMDSRPSRARRAEALAPRLDLLVRREILTVETDPRAPTRGQHAFVQALVREVAYGTLAKRERRERHLAAARYLESLGDEELAGVVASHFVAAYRSAPDGPAGEAVAAQARVSLLAAADRAEALGAFGQAIDALTSALEVTRAAARPGPAARAHRLAVDSALALRRGPGDASPRRSTRTGTIGDEIGVIRAVARRVIGYVSSRRRSPPRSRSSSRSAGRRGAAARTDLVGDDGDAEAGEAAAMIAEAIGRIAFRNNDMDEAIRWCDRALALAEPLRLDEIVAMALVTKGTALIVSGTASRGHGHPRGGDPRCSRTRSVTGRAAREQQSRVDRRSTRIPRAHSSASREGMALARRLGLLSFDCYHAGNAMSAAERLGEWAWAREAIGALVDAHPEGMRADWIAACADLDGRSGWAIRTSRASNASAARAARERFADRVEHERLARTMCVRGWPTGGRRSESEPVPRPLPDGHWTRRVRMDATVRPSHRAARRRADDAGCGPRPARRRHRPRPRRMSEPGSPPPRAGPRDALGLYRSALAGYREAGCRFDVALTILDMAVLIGPDEPAVRASIPEGREILESLGARILLERLDALEPEGRHLARRRAPPDPTPPRRSRPSADRPCRQVEGGSRYSPPQWTRGGRGSKSSTSSGASSGRAAARRPYQAASGPADRPCSDDRQQDGPGDDRGQGPEATPASSRPSRPRMRNTIEASPRGPNQPTNATVDGANRCR